jgi:hypothetical protein
MNRAEATAAARNRDCLASMALSGISLRVDKI